MIAPRVPILRFANFLAPVLNSAYDRIAEAVGRRLGIETSLTSPDDYEQANEYDVCFVCGLAYVELARNAQFSHRPIAAPVLAGERFQGKPIYYSDVIVRRDSDIHSFADVRGCTWSYNEPLSQSGYGITRYWLAQFGESRRFFGKVVRAGWHQKSIEWVRAGSVDASAVDCHTLAMTFRRQPDLKNELRIVASLGPSTIQPITVNSRLPKTIQDEIQTALVELHNDADMRRVLRSALMARLVPVGDRDYDDIRSMNVICSAAKVSTLD